MPHKNHVKLRAYMRKYCLQWAKDNPERVKRYWTTHATRRKAAIDAIKAEKGCVDCDEDSPFKYDPTVLDFHHLDPTTKKFCVGHDVRRSWDSILAEIEKCIVLCANHHRIREEQIRFKSKNGNDDSQTTGAK